MGSDAYNTPVKVFCSHRGIDKPEVRAFAAALRAAGIDAWFDQWEIGPGDDIVAKMNDGLDQCHVGLVFFSNKEHDGPWFRAEVATLTFEMIENGKRLIPVMIDLDAPIPAFLRPRARRSIDDFDAIVAAIRGKSAKPPIGPQPAPSTVHRLGIQLDAAGDGRFNLVARSGDGDAATELARLDGLTLPPALRQNFAEFLHGGYAHAYRGPTEAASLSLEAALLRLGDELGRLLFAGPVADHLQRSLAGLAVGDSLELVFASADATLLGLPFEAARLPDGRVPALEPATVIRRQVLGAPAVARAPQAGPLKLLVAVGAPDEGHTANAVLDLENELQGILDAVDKAAQLGNAQVKILEVGHPDEIRKALTADAFHVLHLSCHGNPGAIELEDEDGHAIQTTAADLAAALRAANRPLPLIFLATCHGGSPAGEAASFAQALVQAGVPQVLAMQTRVTDRYASELAAAFYGALGTPEFPSASRALAEARRTLEAARRKAGQPTPPEYATPSLFCAGAEQPLLDRSLDQAPLRRPSVHVSDNLAVPTLTIGELIGRRTELRKMLRALRAPGKGKRAGVVLQGIGGIGKSALAGRGMARLTEDGWICAAITGAFDNGSLTEAIRDAIGNAKARADEKLRPPLDPEWRVLDNRLRDPATDDRQRLALIQRALRDQPLLIVLDNFETNLAPASSVTDFIVPLHREWLRALCVGASGGRGSVLLTSRYLPPGFNAWLEAQPLAPLSAAQTRKLIRRLPMLLAQIEQHRDALPWSHALQTILLRVGGHPRMLEYLNALLSHADSRIGPVADRLAEQAEAAGVDARAASTDLDEVIGRTLLIGAHDVFLAELLALADKNGDRPALLQAAASNLPIAVAGVAHALHDVEPDDSTLDATRAALERLAELSLLGFVGEDEIFVHRWTAEVLLAESLALPAEARRATFARAGHYRLWRVQNQTHDLTDGIEAVRNLLAAEAFDEAASEALQIRTFLTQNRQLAAAGSFAGEVCAALPPTHPNFAALADTEAEALLALGYTDAALARYRQLLEHHEQLVQAEPQRADYQHDLAASYQRLGDLMTALGQGDAARDYCLKTLDIAQRLAQAEPQRADYQRDLSVSYNKLGDLMTAIGQGNAARDYFIKALDIAQRLAQAEPQRADYQRDLSVSYNKLGDLMTALGQGNAARDYFIKDLDIAQRLAQAEPQRADYQRDLIVSLVRMANVAPDQAVAHLGRALDIARALKAAGLSVQGLGEMIGALEQMLAEAGRSG